MSTLNVARVILSSGLKLPEYTTANLPAGELGLMVYDSTDKKIKVFDGGWNSLDSSPLVATGGSATTANGFKTHVFTGDSAFTVTAAGTAEVLVVAGGGGGGGSHQGGGGGGAGGLVYHPSKYFPVGSYGVTIGGGGQGGRYYGGSTTGNYGTTNNSHGFQGGNSQIADILAIGGGGGNESFYTRSVYKDGGSGGGGGDYYTGVSSYGWTGGFPLQMNSGGGIGFGNPGGSRGYAGPTEVENNSHEVPHEGAGGGGAGGPGGKAMGTLVDATGTATDGGIGKFFEQFSTIAGSPGGWFAGGGGGGFYWYGPYTPTNAPGSNTGAKGGGGRGYGGQSATGNTAGVANTGGGGGGGSGNNTPPNALPGGSGIVIVRYKI